MSLKGFQKSVVRTPQLFKAKFNIGEITKDPIYIDAERRFQDLETETKKLRDESKQYSDAINGMLNHQIEFSKAMTEIYKPISGRPSDPLSLEVHGNVEGIRACEEYEAIVKDLQETVAPELEMIETRIVRPAAELMDVIKVIRKTAVKRDHKQLDYDRHRATLKKLQEKKEKSAKDEKAMWKAENEVETATQEFNYFNDLLKEELPRLFALERDFIQPLFQSFYYMQLNIFYTLHEKMQHCDIGYFDLTRDVEEAFLAKRGDVQEQAESLSIVKFKTTGQKRPPKYGGASKLLEGKTASSASSHLLTAGPSSTASTPKPWERSSSTTTPTDQQQQSPYATAAHPASYLAEAPGSHASPPPYTPGTTPSSSAALAAAQAARSKPAPPPPKPKPSRLSHVPAPETVTALYAYAAQAEGDLSFRAGDVIEIVTRTANENEWWVGRLHGKEGQFPGNYVQLNS